MTKTKKTRHPRKKSSPLQRLTSKYAKLSPDERFEALNLHQNAIARAQTEWEKKDREPWSKPQTKPKGYESSTAKLYGKILGDGPGIERNDLSDDKAPIGEKYDFNQGLFISPETERDRGLTREEVEQAAKEVKEISAAIDRHGYNKPPEGASKLKETGYRPDVEKLLKEVEDDLKGIPSTPVIPKSAYESDEALANAVLPAVVGQLLSSKLSEKVLPREPGTYIVEIGDGGVLNEIHLVTPRDTILLPVEDHPLHVEVSPAQPVLAECNAPEWQARPKGLIQPLPRPTPEQYAEKAQSDSEAAVEGLTQSFVLPVFDSIPPRKSWWQRFLNWFRS